jgi:hypothetical protein
MLYQINGHADGGYIAAHVAAALCGALGVYFLVSAWAKLRDLEAFRLICIGYPGAAMIGVRTASWLIVCGETGIGALLIVPLRGGITYGIAVALLWTAAASAAVAVRRLRGERWFRCGCGADLSEETSADFLLFRNALLMAGLTAALARGGVSSMVSFGGMQGLLVAADLVLGAYLIGAAARTWRQLRQWQAT